MASETSEANFSLTNMVHKNYEHVVHDVSRRWISQLKIGFDLDGVLCDTDMNFLRLLERVLPFQDDLEKMMEFEAWYFNERKPLLNPENFLSEGDEYYVITGRDNEFHGEVTERWCRKFTPNASGVYCVGEYPKLVEEGKAKKIVELGLDVYIDDHPVSVRKLRAALPSHVKVIQYGGRWIK